MDGRIVDFFCPARSLIVEVDGDTHEAGRDAFRDALLSKERGFLTVRFGNRDVMDNLDGVLERLLSILEGQPDRWPAATTPDPSSEEEGRVLK